MTIRRIALASIVAFWPIVADAQLVNPTPIATSSTVGTVKPDNSSTTVDSNGTIHATGGSGAVSSVFGRTGTVTAQSGDYSVGQITGAAPTASPALTGTPTAPTPTALDNSTKLATTAFVDGALPAVPTGANPTATIGATAVNGSSSNFMRSDGSPALPATLPALSGVNLTALNATNLASGTVAAARMPAYTGDATSSAGATALTLAASGVSAATYGDATHSAQIAIDTKGRTTSASNVTITPALASITGFGTGNATALSIPHDTTGGPCTVGGTGCPSGGLPTAQTQASQLYGSYLTSASNIVTYGDSITAGTVLLSSKFQAYPYLIQNDMGPATFTNEGLSGTYSCDNLAADFGVFDSAMGEITTPSNSSQAFYSEMFGTNEAQTSGVGGYEANYKSCLAANAAWLATPLSSKIKATSATATGTWVADNAPHGATYGLASTTNGSTLTFSGLVTNGGPIYIWYKAYDGDAGTFTYAIDGGSAVTVNGFTSTPIMTQQGATIAMLLARTAVPSVGTHTVVITVTSATNANNKVAVWAVGSPQNIIYQAEQTTVIGGVLPQGANANSAATAAYDADALATANLLIGDGLPVRFAPVRNYVSVSNMGSSGNLHPNQAGQVQLHDAFEAVAQPVLTQGAYTNLGAFNARYTIFNDQYLDPTGLNGGIFWGQYAGQYDFGADIGYDATNSTYWNRIFCGAIGSTCETAIGHMPANPTAQSSFVPDFIVSPSAVTSKAPIVPPGYTVSTLPASPPKGALAFVTDAVACTFLGTLTGGGSTYCPVNFNGTSWIAG